MRLITPYQPALGTAFDEHGRSCEEAVRERRAERAGQVVALLGPVEAVADDWAPALAQRLQVDAEVAQELGSPPSVTT